MQHTGENICHFTILTNNSKKTSSRRATVIWYLKQVGRINTEWLEWLFDQNYGIKCKALSLPNLEMQKNEVS